MPQIFVMCVGIAERFSRSKVNCRDQTACYNGAVMHFDAVASRHVVIGVGLLYQGDKNSLIDRKIGRNVIDD